MSHSANYRDTGPTTIYYQGLHEGIRQEQERIIKLLLDEVRYDFPPVIEMSVHNLIALIKGEQK